MADRSITTGFWEHDDVEGLSGLDKSIYLYLITAPGSNLCGLYIATYKTIAFHTQWSVQEVKRAITHLCKKNRIVYDDSLVFVRNMSKWQKAEKFGGFKHHVRKIANDLKKPENEAYKAFLGKFRTLIEGSENPSRTLPQNGVQNEPSKKGSRTLNVISNNKKVKKGGVGESKKPSRLHEEKANPSDIPGFVELEKELTVS